MNEWSDREDKIRIKYIRGSIGVASIVKKIRENRLRWFGSMMSREKTKAVRVVMRMNVERRKGRGKPKIEGWIRLRVI